MGLLQTISDFFELLFNRSSPEVQKKLQLKKIETDLKQIQPVLYRNGNILPNFAEAIHQLYLNTKPLDDLFQTTISDNDIPRRSRFEAQLVLTGFSVEDQQQLERLSYANRKQEIVEADDHADRTFEQQHRELEKLSHALNTENFKSIDKDMMQVHQLADFCRFNFVTILQVFDNNFVPLDLSYVPSYQELPLTKIGNVLEDLYYQMYGLQITNAVSNAVLALAQLKNGGSLSSDQTDSLTGNIKKTAYIISHILTPDYLKRLICLYKGDANYQAKTVTYHESARQEFAKRIESQFKADEQRIKTEIKDERISAELSNLFPNVQLSTLQGYSQETNEKLQANTPLAFQWIMPMQILKTFLQVYITEPVKSLLNDIVIEGFFNNSTYKTDFSANVYAVFECSDRIQEFENSFEHGKPNDTALIEGFIKDSHKDSGFYKKMESMVDSINETAKKIVQEESSELHTLYGELGELLNDAKKPNCEIISNLKVLMMSSRNRDNTDLLEQQYPNWQIFFEIMKNYAIINVKEIPA